MKTQTLARLIKFFAAILIVGIGLFALPLWIIRSSQQREAAARAEAIASEGLNPAQQSTLTYLLSWDSRGTNRLPQGGWQVTNDLGYSITVEQGHLANYWAQLVPCQSNQNAGLPDLLAAAILPGVASAGHGSDNNGTRTLAPLLEDLGSPASFATMGSMLVDFDAYCQLHYVLAAGESYEGGSQDGYTLWIEGNYRAPGSAEDQPFVLSSTEAYGALLDLRLAVDPAQTTLLHTATLEASILLQRDLSGLFDGIDLATVSSEEGGWQFLRQAVRSTLPLVTEGCIHGPAAEASATPTP